MVAMLLLTLLPCLLSGAHGGESFSVRERLRQRVELAGIPLRLAMGDQFLYASSALPLFYERRGFVPAWVSGTGPGPMVRELLGALSEAEQEGLRSGDYHLDQLISLQRRLRRSGRYNRPGDQDDLVDLELLCTDAFLIYGSHLLSGRINSETIDAEWFANRKEGDLAAVLENAVASRRVDSTLQSLLPRPQEYRQMKVALARYRKVVAEGGWESIPEGRVLKQGDVGPRVAALRRRLALSGDLAGDAVAEESDFDAGLSAALVRFQVRHGLEPDGAAGQATLKALNVSAEQRVEQLVTNLERWRWLPQELELKYVLINIANFELTVIEDDSAILTMPVIVGRSYRRTPVFSDRLTYLVLNPYWHVPPGLAANDILPEVRKNPAYLTENDYEVLRGSGSDASVVDPDTVEWSAMGTGNLPYRFRQKPGAKNALGRIKFMFPNQFNVYLHDTPARGLFAKIKRDFSSGCLRIAKPLELAEYLLADDVQWSRQAIEAVLQREREQTVRLPAAVPIHILYWTAWADADGTVHFREDIYDRDGPLWEALAEEPPVLNSGP